MLLRMVSRVIPAGAHNLAMQARGLRQIAGLPGSQNELMLDQKVKKLDKTITSGFDTYTDSGTMYALINKYLVVTR